MPRRGALLLFDEADSLLFDWNPLPVIAMTNHEKRLDPATLRRFVFKLRLMPLGRESQRRWLPSVASPLATSPS